MVRLRAKVRGAASDGEGPSRDEDVGGDARLLRPLEEQAQHMRDWGFVRLKGFVAPQTLARLQTEFRKEQAAVLQAEVQAEQQAA